MVFEALASGDRVQVAKDYLGAKVVSQGGVDALGDRLAVAATVGEKDRVLARHGLIPLELPLS